MSVGGVELSPDGRTAVVTVTRPNYERDKNESELYAVDVATGAARQLTFEVRMVGGAHFSPDGKTLAFVAPDSAGKEQLWLMPTTGGASRRLDTGDLVINGAFGYDIAVSAHAPTIAFTATSTDRPSEMYVMDGPDATPRRLTDFNAWAADVAWGKLERVTWKSGPFEADGVLGYPPDFDPSKKYPLVLLIHGGPTSASKLAYSATAQLLAAQGWLVFQPNYRGSDNLGNSYQAAIVNDAGLGPGRDVMAGVAMLRARPYVDATRTATTGWSYGGFMTSWLIGRMHIDGPRATQ